MTRDEVLDKARKLMELARRGSTEGEIAAASEALSRLLRNHNLSVGEVTQREIEADVKKEIYETEYKTYPSWLTHLAMNITKPFNVRVILTGRQKAGFWFIGRSLDVEVAHYFFDMLYFRLWELAKRDCPRNYAGSERTSFCASYVIAASRVICSRLEKENQRDVPPTEMQQSNALMVVQNTAIDAWIQREFPNTRTSNVSMYDSRLGTRAGREAGASIGLHRGVGGSVSNQKRLT